MDALATKQAVDLEMKIRAHGYHVKRSDAGMIGPHFDILSIETHAATISKNPQTGNWRLSDDRGFRGLESKTIGELTPRVLDFLGIIGNK